MNDSHDVGERVDACLGANGDRIRRAVVDCVSSVLHCGPDQIRDIDTLVDTFGAESMDFAEILFRLERMFDVALPIPDVAAAARAWTGDGTGARAMTENLDGDYSGEDVFRQFTTETLVRLVAWRLVERNTSRRS